MSSYKLPNEQVYNILNNKKGETSGALKIVYLSFLILFGSTEKKTGLLINSLQINVVLLPQLCQELRADTKI